MTSPTDTAVQSQEPSALPPRPTHGGTITLSERAVSRIVAQAATSVEGTVSLDRSIERLGRTYPRFDVQLTSPTPGSSETGSVSVDAHIAVEWPCPVTAVADEVRSRIKTWVEQTTGLHCPRVNVVVGAVDYPENSTPRLASRVVDVTKGREAPAQAPEVTPSYVRQPITAEQRELRPITITPAPGLMGKDAAWTPATPSPVAVSSPTIKPRMPEAFVPNVPEPVRPASPSVPEPVRPVSPSVPDPVRPFSPVVRSRPEPPAPKAPRPVKVFHPTAPRPLTPYRPQAPTPQPLKPVVVQRHPEITPTVTPRRTGTRNQGARR